MKILIVKTSSLGDIIHAYPALTYLKNKFPDAEIDFVVEKPCRDLVLQHPFVSNTIEIDTRTWRKGFSKAIQGILEFRRAIRKKTYDVCFDLQCNIKSGLIVSLVKCKNKVGFGFKTAIERPNCLFNNIRFNPTKSCNVRDENLFLVKEYFKDRSEEAFNDQSVKLKITQDEKILIDQILLNEKILKKPLVMACPGSMWQNKQISENAMNTFLIKLQQDLDCSFIFVSGTEKEKAYAEELTTLFSDRAISLGRLPLAVLQNLMSKMQLVIAMDSLPLHLAGTTGVSTFSFFGPSSSSKYMPTGKNHHAFQGACPYGRTIERRCPILRSCKTGACLKTPSGDTLFAAYKSSGNGNFS